VEQELHAKDLQLAAAHGKADALQEEVAAARQQLDAARLRSVDGDTGELSLRLGGEGHEMS